MREVDASALTPAFEVDGKTVYLYNDELYEKTTVREIYGGVLKFSDALECLKYVHLYCSTYFGTDGPRDSREHMIEAAQKDMAKYLLVGSDLYYKTTEPRYVVCTYGCGHNHGGTKLNVSWHENPNMDSGSYFCALDADLAIQHANDVAKVLGDTDDIGTFQATIKVLNSAAVKLPRRPERKLYEKQELWTILWDSDKGRNWERLPKDKALELIENLCCYGINELYIFKPDSEVPQEALEAE